MHRSILDIYFKNEENRLGKEQDSFALIGSQHKRPFSPYPIRANHLIYKKILRNKQC